MLGVITNFRDWIFTRYSMFAELKIGKELHKTQTTKWDDNHEFEYSNTFRIFEINRNAEKIEFDDKQFEIVLSLLRHSEIYYGAIE